jgi:predicted negative regulator of RcsB-dependent stress response
MAFDAYDDYEQSERVQKWLRQNGLSIVVGVVIGLVAIFGWQQWRNHRAGREAAAAEIYQQAQSAALSGNTEGANRLTAQLTTDYPGSTSTLFALGNQAQREAQAGQLDKALQSLNASLALAKDDGLKSLIQLRVARVELASGKADATLATLGQLPPKHFEGMSEELRGDALVKLGRLDDARKAYQTALQVIGDDAPQRGALQMKIDDLAVAGKQGA